MQMLRAVLYLVWAGRDLHDDHEDVTTKMATIIVLRIEYHIYSGTTIVLTQTPNLAPVEWADAWLGTKWSVSGPIITDKNLPNAN